MYVIDNNGLTNMMTLRAYIEKEWGGSQANFFRAASELSGKKVWPQMVTNWIAGGYVVHDGMMYGPRRKVPVSTESVMPIDHPDHNVPSDWVNPCWGEEQRMHNWRNYAGNTMQEIWPTFSVEQKQVISERLANIASNEVWD